MIRPWSPPPAVAGMVAIVRLLPRVSRPMTLALTVGVIAETAFPLAFTVITGNLIGSIPAAVKHGLDSADGRQVLFLLACAAVATIGGRLVAPVVGALGMAIGRLVDRHLQERVIAAVNRPRGISHLEEPETLNLIEQAQGLGSGGIRPGQGVAALATLLPSWLLALGSALILTAFHWWLGVAWFLAWPVILYFLQREYIRVGGAGSGQAAALRRAEYYRDLALTPAAAKEVRLWGLTDWLAQRYEHAWRSAMVPTWKRRKPGRAVIWAAAASVATADFAVFALLAWSALHGQITLSALAIYTQAIVRTNTFRAFDNANMELAFAAVAVPALLALERRLNDRVLPAFESPIAARVTGDICLRDITFRYPNQGKDTLRSLNLTIRAGESLAIVGANGAGKTTIVKLLCRLYDPQCGQFTIGDTEVLQSEPRSWRTQVAAIFQDFARYHLSARENIAMGAPQSAHDVQRLRSAARRAGALELIEALPNGWDTVLSRQYVAGVDLSGGQWQRIALARALFAVEGGASLLILDEPTANLDVRAEAEIYDRFLDLTAGLTTVLISHRFSTVRRAHRIVVLDDGCVTEEGSHDELMALDGTYARMFRLQAERFAAGLLPVLPADR